MSQKIYFFSIFLFLLLSIHSRGQGDGLITKDGNRMFPIGYYYLPKDDQKLREVKEAGFNIIRCSAKDDLDRAQSAGLMGWLPLSLHNGTTDEFKKKVDALVNHPALALWEGPDEVVWWFTGTWDLYYKQKIHEKPETWWKQDKDAIDYANERSASYMPNINSAISYIRSVDTLNRQIWINEAAASDTKYIRQYLDNIDITGCDKYPIMQLGESDPYEESHLYSNGKYVIEQQPTQKNGEVRKNVDDIKFYTRRFMEVGRGKPVYMVLQAFSWPELGGDYWSSLLPVYPSFNESRYMAYIAIATGAKGIYYWGANYTKSEEFIQSIYAVTSELSALQPFLVSPEENHMNIRGIKTLPDEKSEFSGIVRRYGRDWLIVVINETDDYPMSVVVENLEHLNGMKFYELYGEDEFSVSNEEMVLRMKPREIKVLSTSKRWKTKRTMGRDYAGR
ncbi:MAG: hypothetical protein ACOCVA_02725 [Prolixibacteraceae bacterium]